MSAFRDQLAIDVDAVFLSAEDFGETLVIDGTTVRAVRDDDLTIERTQGPKEAQGIFAQRRVLFLASGQMDTPVEGQRLLVGALRWYVEQVSEAEGMLEITLLRQAS